MSRFWWKKSFLKTVRQFQTFLLDFLNKICLEIFLIFGFVELIYWEICLTFKLIILKEWDHINEFYTTLLFKCIILKEIRSYKCVLQNFIIFIRRMKGNIKYNLFRWI